MSAWVETADIQSIVRFGSYTGGGVIWKVGFRSLGCWKAAQKLKQRRVDLGWQLMLKPVARILDQPDVAKVGALPLSGLTQVRSDGLLSRSLMVGALIRDQ